MGLLSYHVSGWRLKGEAEDAVGFGHLGVLRGL